MIWNGATVAGLISASSTSPTLPSGYTHKGLVGALFNNSASNFDSISQSGRFVSIAPLLIPLSAGVQTAVTLVSLANCVPPSVRAVMLHCTTTATTATEGTGSIWADSGGTIVVAKIGDAGTTSSSDSIRAHAFAVLRTSQTLWYSVTAAQIQFSIQPVGYIW